MAIRTASDDFRHAAIAASEPLKPTVGFPPTCSLCVEVAPEHEFRSKQGLWISLSVGMAIAGALLVIFGMSGVAAGQGLTPTAWVGAALGVAGIIWFLAVLATNASHFRSKAVRSGREPWAPEQWSLPCVAAELEDVATVEKLKFRAEDDVSIYFDDDRAAVYLEGRRHRYVIFGEHLEQCTGHVSPLAATLVTYRIGVAGKQVGSDDVGQSEQGQSEQGQSEQGHTLSIALRPHSLVGAFADYFVLGHQAKGLANKLRATLRFEG